MEPWATETCQGPQLYRPGGSAPHSPHPSEQKAPSAGAGTSGSSGWVWWGKTRVWTNAAASGSGHLRTPWKPGLSWLREFKHRLSGGTPKGHPSHNFAHLFRGDFHRTKRTEGCRRKGKGAKRDNWKGLLDLSVYLGGITGFELRNNIELRDNRVRKDHMFGFSRAAPDLPYIKIILLFWYFDI